jgi:hypothetical protein
MMKKRKIYEGRRRKKNAKKNTCKWGATESFLTLISTPYPSSFLWRELMVGVFFLQNRKQATCEWRPALL